MLARFDVRAVVLDGGVVALASVVIVFGSQQVPPWPPGAHALDPWA